MCTAFVRKGKDVIVGFNMDINMGAVDYDVYVEPDQFYVGVRPAGVANAYPELIDNYERNGELPVIRIQGINHKGNFGNCLNNMCFTKASFRLGENVISIDHIVDDYISGTNNLSKVVITSTMHNHIIINVRIKNAKFIQFWNNFLFIKKLLKALKSRNL